MASIRLNELAVCSMCMVDFEEPCEISILGCHDLHFLHTSCIDEWIKWSKKNNKKAGCPMCRKDIDESKIKLRMYKGLKDIMNPQDEPGAKGKDEMVEMFGLDTKEKPIELGDVPVIVHNPQSEF